MFRFKTFLLSNQKFILYFIPLIILMSNLLSNQRVFCEETSSSNNEGTYVKCQMIPNIVHVVSLLDGIIFVIVMRVYSGDTTPTEIAIDEEATIERIVNKTIEIYKKSLEKQD